MSRISFEDNTVVKRATTAEIDALIQGAGNGVVKLLLSWQDSAVYYYRMPRALYTLEDVPADITRDVCCKLLLDVCTGLETLLSADILHLDLKPDNILVYRDSCGMYACVADFDRWTSVNNPRAGKAFALGFRAPELFAFTVSGKPLLSREQLGWSNLASSKNTKPISTSALMWALGMVVLELLHGQQHPCIEADDWHEYLIDRFLIGPLDVPAGAEHMFAWQPHHRATLLDIRGYIEKACS